MSLIESLTQQFGLNQGQAEGAVGAIVRAAQSKLSGDQMGELGKLIPGLGGMIQNAPQPSAGGGLFGGLGGMLGGSLGQAASLAGVFKALNIDVSQIAPIAKAVLAFVQANGSEGLKSTLGKLASQFGAV